MTADKLIDEFGRLAADRGYLTVLRRDNRRELAGTAVAAWAGGILLDACLSDPVDPCRGDDAVIERTGPRNRSCAYRQRLTRQWVLAPARP